MPICVAMAISRPFLLALIGLALLGATVFAVQNARDDGSDAPAPAAEQGQAQPGQSASQPAADLSPQQTLEAAFASDVKSAKLDGGFVATDGKAWLLKDGVGYQVPEDAWKAVLDSAAKQNATPAPLPVDPS